MDLLIGIAIVAMAVGMLALLPAAILVASNDDGRFRGDPFVTPTAGFGLIYLGQYLVR